MRLVVGLGNYPEKYKGTRHNVGFDSLDCYLKHKNIDVVWKKAYKGLFFKERDVFFLKPYTLMNLSGNSVGDLCRYYRIEPCDILIIHDDIDFPVGRVKITRSRGAGGHNGVQSVINAIGKDFYRIRVGIRNDFPRSGTRSDFVLSPFARSELEELRDNVYPLIYKTIDSFRDDDMENVMNLINRISR